MSCFVEILCLSVFLFFFFKQKTAYEMRISDWSSDVCSSDLGRLVPGRQRRAADLGEHHQPDRGVGGVEILVLGKRLEQSVAELAERILIEAAEQAVLGFLRHFLRIERDRKSTRLNSSH